MKSSYVYLGAISLVFTLNSNSVLASEEDEMAEMQRRLNAEVMEKPFSVEDEQKIDAYIKKSMEKSLKPSKKIPKFWKPGYTCADIYRYGWNYYRSCRYYRHYYGYYWN